MWWEKQLEEFLHNSSEDFLRDWLVSYEYETGDKSLRGISKDLFLVVLLNRFFYSNPFWGRSDSSGFFGPVNYSLSHTCSICPALNSHSGSREQCSFNSTSKSRGCYE